MKTSEAGIAFIKRFEGFRPDAYRDSAGLLTIGYGHLIKLGETLSNIDEEKAEELLTEDVTSTELGINKSVKTPLTQNQFDALVSFCYNLGMGAFIGSTLLKLINSGNLTDAGPQFLRWVHAGGRVIPGLVTRRQAEAALFETP